MASKRSGLLRLMSHQLPRAVTIRLFKSYVRPTMEYASAVWHGSLKEEDALSIERIQAGVARCLLKAEWCTSKPTLLEQPQRICRCSFSALAECFCGQVLVTRGKFGKPLEPVCNPKQSELLRVFPMASFFGLCLSKLHVFVRSFLAEGKMNFN